MEEMNYYDSDTIRTQLEDDVISAEEAAFMEGYLQGEIA
jgi:hypothetical protein